MQEGGGQQWLWAEGLEAGSGEKGVRQRDQGCGLRVYWGGSQMGESLG